MIEEEKIVIKESFMESQERLKEMIKKLSETINLSDYMKSMKFDITEGK